MVSFMQVTWCAHKGSINAKGNDFILALKFHLLEGVHGAL